MSTPDPLRSNGLPDVIKDFTLAGKMASMDTIDPLLTGRAVTVPKDPPARAETDVRPLVLNVPTHAGD